MSTIKEITVPGTDFTIKADTIYTVLPKVDPNAPDGFKEHGTTKVIHPSVGNTVGAPYDRTMGVWDTGFYTHSPCLVGMPVEAKNKFIKDVNEFIVTPVEEIKGQGELDHKNNKFFDNLAITLANKVHFNTANPLDRLGLYFAVLGKELCPKDMVGNPLFGGAAYQVVNKEVEVSNKEQAELDNARAIGELYNLIRNDKDFLSKVFKYLRISDATISDEKTFVTVFNRYLKDKQDGYRNSTLFLKEIDKFRTKEGAQELEAYIMLLKLYDQKIVQINKSEYYLKGVSIGNSLKHAAMNAAKDPELMKQIVELSAEEDED